MNTKSFLSVMMVWGLVLGQFGQASKEGPNKDSLDDPVKQVQPTRASGVTEDYGNFLPNEIWIEIFKLICEDRNTQLTPNQIDSKNNIYFLAARQVSKHWNNLIRSINLTSRVKFAPSNLSECEEWESKYSDLLLNKKELAFYIKIEDPMDSAKYLVQLHQIYPSITGVHLNISSTKNCSDPINQFINNLIRIHTLELKIHPNSPFLDLNESILTIARFTDLKSLNFFKTTVPVDFLKDLSSLTNLTDLGLYNKLGERTDLNDLAPFTNLTSLNINQNPKLKNFDALSLLTKLTMLEMGNTNVTDSTLTSLTSLTNLRILDLSKKSTFGKRLTDYSLNVLKPLTNLEELWIKGQGIQNTQQFEIDLKKDSLNLRKLIF